MLAELRINRPEARLQLTCNGLTGGGNNACMAGCFYPAHMRRGKVIGRVVVVVVIVVVVVVVVVDTKIAKSGYVRT